MLFRYRYLELTTLILETGLSGLGHRNPRTPELSVNSALNSYHKAYFINKGDGYFAIDSSEAFFSDELKEAYDSYIKWRHLKNEKERLEAREERNKNAKIVRQKYLLEITTNDIESFEDEHFYELTEGNAVERFVSFYERNPKLRQEAILIHGTKCMVPNCGFDFEKTYGRRGKDYIEVHHKKPLFTLDKPEAINPSEDMVVVCSNCHRIIHREKNNILTIEEISELIEKNNIIKSV